MGADVAGCFGMTLGVFLTSGLPLEETLGWLVLSLITITSLKSTFQTLTGGDVLFCYNASGRSRTCVMLVESRKPCMTFAVLPLNHARMLPARLVVGEGATFACESSKLKW